MATNTAGSTGRQFHQQLVHYISRYIALADATNGVAYTLGVIPPRAIVLRGGVAVIEAFNYGTNNLLDIGTSGDDDGFATNLALTTIGIIAADEMATSNDFYSTSEQTITFTPELTGTAGTTGKIVVWMEFLVPNDRGY